MESQEERRSGVEEPLSERYAAPFRQKWLFSRAERLGDFCRLLRMQKK